MAYCMSEDVAEGTDLSVQETVALRGQVKRFVQETTAAGKVVDIVTQEGHVEMGCLKLTSNLQILQLEMCDVVHEIPLKTVSEVCTGVLTGSASAPVQLDDSCSTIVLKNE